MMEPTERALLHESVQGALADAVAAGNYDVDSVLAKMGWIDVLAAEPSDAIDVVFGALGATNTRSTALDDVLMVGFGLEPSPRRAVLLPAFATWDPPGAAGLATARASNKGELLVVVDREHACMIPMTHVRQMTVKGIDPDVGLQRVEIDALDGLDVSVHWDAGVDLARRAIGHEISGACRAMLNLARTHALERVQFDRPIARFQAVRHRLAEAFVSIEALDAALSAAADSANADTALVAKAVAGRTARTVATHCQQVLAGIGFTTDHAFHRYLKRTMLLDGLFGTGNDLERDFGVQLLDRRAVPTLIEL